MSLLTWYKVIALIMAWLPLCLPHREKSLCFGPELQENWLFDFVSHVCETSVRPDTSEASLFSDDVVLKWAGTLDCSACVCAMHSTSLSWASPHPFPALLSFYILIYFKAASLCHACIWLETSYNLLTHPPAYHFVWNTAIIPPNR